MTHLSIDKAYLVRSLCEIGQNTDEKSIKERFKRAFEAPKFIT